MSGILSVLHNDFNSASPAFDFNPTSPAFGSGVLEICFLSAWLLLLDGSGRFR